MYNLKIINHYPDTVQLQGGGKVSSGDTGEVNNLGNFEVTVPGIGTARLFDLGDKKLPNYESYPKETWGVLLRYKSIEAYYRYEGGGQLTLSIDKFGSIVVSTSNGTMVNVSLPELTIAQADG
jgi:hypothetical protein